MEEMDFIVDTAKESMDHALAHLEKEMLNLRAGKANPIMLASVKVDYYGTMTPISQVANVNTPDGRTLTVQPWEKGMLQELEKAILVANLGFNPMNNGESIIINIPPIFLLISIVCNNRIPIQLNHHKDIISIRYLPGRESVRIPWAAKTNFP